MRLYSVVLLLGIQILSRALVSSQRDDFREDAAVLPPLGTTIGPVPDERTTINPGLRFTEGRPTLDIGTRPPPSTRPPATIGPFPTDATLGPFPDTHAPDASLPTDRPSPLTPSQLQTTNTGNEFYIGFMDNYIKPAFLSNERLVLNRSQIYITTAESLGAVTMIESEQGTSMVSVRPGQAMTRTLQDFKVQSGRDRSKGIKIKAEQLKQISVFGLNDELHSTDAFTALPCTFLPRVESYEYYAVSVPPSPVADNTANSAFLIVACSDNTRVSITPTQTISHPYIPNLTIRAGTTFSVQLRERQTLYVQNREDLTGSRIVSDLPISFFTGHECGNVPARASECDHLVEQIPPTLTWGNQFIVAPTATRRSRDLIRVIASADSTSGNVGCVYPHSGGDMETHTGSLARAGNFMEFNLSADGYCFLEADKPVMVVQFTAGGSVDGVSVGDPFMMIVPAVRQYLDIMTFTTMSGHEYQNYINLFVPAGFNTSGVVIDGLSGGNGRDSEWVDIPCPNISRTCGYAKLMAVSDGVHTVWNTNGGPVGVTVYGFSYLESYAYVGGLKLTVPGQDRPMRPRSHFTIGGSSVCLQCHFGDEANTTVVWNKDGETVAYSTSRGISLSPSGSLCIDNVQYSNAGNYICHVPIQGVSYSTSLQVAGGIIVEPSCEIAGVDGPAIGIGQEDTAYLDSSTRSFGICCRVQGPPGYRVSWLRNGEPITSQGYHFGEGFLRFSGSLSNGCAKYTCQVEFTDTQARGSETTEICVGDIAPPTVVNITGPTTVLEKTVVMYHCSADGYPEPTKMWTADRDGDSLLPTSASDDGNGKLTVGVTYLDASRRYCCDVSNRHGQILSKCFMIDVLIPPVIAEGKPSPSVSFTIPDGVQWPLEQPLNATISIGNNVMVPEGYRLRIECKMRRANPQPSIVWHHGDNLIQGPQYAIEEDGTLVIDGVLRDRDEGVYTCIADTPDVGQDQSSSTVSATVPPRINSSGLATSPGNCLDLTKSLVNTQPVGVDLCLRAGEGARITLECNVVDGWPLPNIEWLKDGEIVSRRESVDRFMEEALVLNLPVDAYGEGKEHVEGNYICRAFNTAGSTTMQTHITVFGDIPKASSAREFGRRYADIYNQLYKSVSEHFPGISDGEQHLSFFTSGKMLSYEDFDPGYLYDESEESVLPQTMENMFDLVDIIPDGGSIVFNPHRAPRLQQTYSQLVDLLQAAPSSLSAEEQIATRRYFQEIIRDPGSGDTLPRLSLYLLYKNMYYITKMEVDDLIESKRRGLLGYEFTQWYERNIHTLQMKISDVYMKWEMYADKTEVEERLETLILEDHSQEISGVQALLLASHRMSRFKDEKQYYLVKLYPDTWYKELKNQVRESIEQMQFQLSKLRTEVQMLELTSQYLEKETRKRDALNKLFPSLDPVYQLRCDLDLATLRLQELVRESEDMRYECLISGNPADCHLYWGLQEHIREQVLGNYTEFYWYIHTVEAALNHREFSIPAIASTVSKLQVQINHIQASIDIALSELSDRDAEVASDNRDFFTDFMYNPNPSNPPEYYDFSLPSSLLGRLLWYINPESTRLVPNELAEEYNLTINHLNTALTNVSAKLSRVNVHRRWFKAGLFGSKHLVLANPDVAVSPGEVRPPSYFRELLANGTYQLPLYPTTLLLATDIELTVDVPFIFHTLPTLIKLSYDPHITGGFGPFSFGPPHRASAGDMKFRVGIRDSKISITLPGTQLVGYVCDVVPQHPRQTTLRGHRSIHSTHPDTLVKESEFDQWLFSRKKKDKKLQNGLFRKDPHQANQQLRLTKSSKQTEDARQSVSLPITPTVPLDTATTTVYYNSTL